MQKTIDDYYLKDLEVVIRKYDTYNENIKVCSEKQKELKEKNTLLKEELKQIEENKPEFFKKLEEIKQNEAKLEEQEKLIHMDEVNKEIVFEDFEDKIGKDLKEIKNEIKAKKEEVTFKEITLNGLKNEMENTELANKELIQTKINSLENELATDNKAIEELEQKSKCTEVYLRKIEGNRNIDELRKYFGINTSKEQPKEDKKVEEVVNKEEKKEEKEEKEDVEVVEEEPADVSIITGENVPSNEGIKRWADYTLADGTTGRIDLDECMSRKEMKKLFKDVNVDKYLDEYKYFEKLDIKKNLNPVILKAFLDNDKTEELDKYIQSVINEEKEKIKIEYDLTNTENKKGSLKKLNDRAAKDMMNVGANAIGIEKTRTVKKLMKDVPSLLEQNEVRTKSKTSPSEEFRKSKQIDMTEKKDTKIQEEKDVKEDSKKEQKEKEQDEQIR